MDWEKHFAARARRVRRNTVREFLRYAGQPGMISFAGGMPDPHLLPFEALATTAARVAGRFGAKALQYGPSEGIPELRDYVAGRSRAVGARAENVLITSGSQQALDLLGRVLLEEGSTVVVQNPTYLAALSAWTPFNVHFCPAERWESESRTEPSVALNYWIANFRNPSGETLSLGERQSLVQRSSDLALPLLEDDAYGELRYEGTPLPSMLEICGTLSGCVVQTGTLSKVLAPGLRLGWIVGEPALIDQLVRVRQAMDLHTSTLAQYVALDMIENGVLDQLLPRLRDRYCEKRDLMLAALRHHMPPGVTWTRPEGGLFIMLYLPPGHDGRAVAARALSRGVAVIPGEEFHVEGGQSTLRLNFSHPHSAEIERGIRILAEAV